MGIRNSSTTHPRKKARRTRALENFTVTRVRMDDEDYMARKRQEYMALKGDLIGFAYMPQRLAHDQRVVAA